MMAMASSIHTYLININGVENKMTPEEKTEAIEVLDANIPSSQSVDSSGKYVQIKPYLPDGKHTVYLMEYVAPPGIPAGVGFCRYVSVPEDGDADLINVFAVPFGPSPWASGWSTYRLSPRV